MEKYDNIGQIGEGSYGMVMKCRHKVRRKAGVKAEKEGREEGLERLTIKRGLERGGHNRIGRRVWP